MARKPVATEGQQELFEPSCPNGVPLNQAISILIKEMRRGNEIESLYWAFQIEERFYKYLWRRLAIFAAEDVGFENPNLIVQIRSLWESYMQIMVESSSKAKPDGNLLAMAVMMSCRSNKNREIDHIKNMVGHLVKDAGWSPEIPDYAIDMHTKAGRDAMPNPHDRTRNWMMVAEKVVPDTGYRDGYLWHLRNMQKKGSFSEEEVDAIEQQLLAEGKLRLHPDAYPKITYVPGSQPRVEG